MAKRSRVKGATFEREIAHQLSQHYGLKITRRLGQARDSGEDIIVGRLTIECKRRKSLKGLYAWMRQAIAATVETPRTPIVVLRDDGNAPLVLLRLEDFLLLTDSEIKPTIHEEPS